MTYKMKGSTMQRNFGISPVKQKSESFNWTGSEEAKKSKILTSQEKTAKYKGNFDKFQAQKERGKQFVKNLGKGASRALGVLGFMGAGSLSATATPTGKQKKEGSYTSDIQDIIPKKEETTKKFPTRKFPTRKF